MRTNPAFQTRRSRQSLAGSRPPPRRPPARASHVHTVGQSGCDPQVILRALRWSIGVPSACRLSAQRWYTSMHSACHSTCTAGDKRSAFRVSARPHTGGQTTCAPCVIPTAHRVSADMHAACHSMCANRDKRRTFRSCLVSAPPCHPDVGRQAGGVSLSAQTAGQRTSTPFVVLDVDGPHNRVHSAWHLTYTPGEEDVQSTHCPASGRMSVELHIPCHSGCAPPRQLASRCATRSAASAEEPFTRREHHAAPRDPPRSMPPRRHDSNRASQTVEKRGARWSRAGEAVCRIRSRQWRELQRR